MKYSITFERILTALAVLLVLGDIALGIAVWKREQYEREAIWTDSYPMANQNITWEGAGYQPIITPEG